jgi:hypothetical protein
MAIERLIGKGNYSKRFNKYFKIQFNFTKIDVVMNVWGTEECHVFGTSSHCYTSFFEYQ